MKLSVQKASKQRKFGRELNKLLKNQPSDKSPLATELQLKSIYGEGGAINQDIGQGKMRRSSLSSVWEKVEQQGGCPYYWNRVTNETTYDPPPLEEDALAPPPPPPPPPKYQLPGLGTGVRGSDSQSVELEAEEAEAHEATATTVETAASFGADEDGDGDGESRNCWKLVRESEELEYYWNTHTNETSYSLPEGVSYTEYSETAQGEIVIDGGGEIGSESESHEAGAALTASLGGKSPTSMWQEIATPDGEVVYMNLVNGDSLTERPAGVTIIVTGEEGEEEVHWQECIGCSSEDEEVAADCPEDSYYYYYQNLATGDVRLDRPAGLVMIAATD